MNFERVPIPNSTAGAAIARRLNDSRTIHAPGSLFFDGPTGIGSQPLPQNLRNRNHSSIPWTFKCSIQKDENGQETGRTGGWSNCRCQIGLDVDWASKDIIWPSGPAVDESSIPEGTHWISGTGTNADGEHYLKVTLNGSEHGLDLAQIVLGDVNTESDPIAGILYIKIGTVQNGILAEPAPHINPVIYKYL